MKYSLFAQHGNEVIYPGAWLRFPLSFLVACLMINKVEPGITLGFFTKPASVNLLCTFLFILIWSEWIYLVSKLLDRRFRKLNNRNERVALQFAYGFLAPVGISCWFAALFLNQRQILNYLNAEMIIPGVFWSCSNAYFLFFSLKARRRLMRPLLYHAQVAIAPVTPAIIFERGRGHGAITANGQELFWPKTLAESMNWLSPGDYFLVNEKALVHKNIIVGYQSGAQSTIELVLAGSLAAKIKLVVCGQSAMAFKQWCKAVGKD